MRFDARWIAIAAGVAAAIAIQRIGNLAWAPPIVGVTSLLMGITGVVFGVQSAGILGGFVGLGATGLVTLVVFLSAWLQAGVGRVASDRLDARLRQNPELKRRIRRHWFFKRLKRH